MLDDRFLSANHQAVAAFQTEDTAAGAAIDEVNAFLAKQHRSLEIIAVITVAAIDKDVSILHAIGQLFDKVADHADGNHQPDDAWFGQF